MKNLRKSFNIFVVAAGIILIPVISCASNQHALEIESINKKPTKCTSCWTGFTSCAKNTYVYLESEDFRKKITDVGTVLDLLEKRGVLPENVALNKIQNVLNLASTASETLDKIGNEDTVSGKLESLLRSANMFTPQIENLFPQATPFLNKINLSNKTVAILEILKAFKRVDEFNTVLDWNEALKQITEARSGAKINLKLGNNGKVDEDDKFLVTGLDTLKNHTQTVGKLLDPTNEKVVFSSDK